MAFLTKNHLAKTGSRLIWLIWAGLLGYLGYYYWRTVPPGITSLQVSGWSDSAAMQVVGAYWGIAHSPGYPLYTVLANLFVRLLDLILPQTEPAWRVSFFSLVLALIGLGLTTAILERLKANRFLAIAAVLVLGTRATFWRYAIIAEVYMLNLVLGLLLIWLALGWYTETQAGQDSLKTERSYLIGLGVTLGALAVHHRTGVLFGAVVGLWMLSCRRDGWRLWFRRLGYLLGFSLPMLFFYAYLPLTASLNAGRTRLYGDASNPAIFWFIIQSREWWGLVQWPANLAEFWTSVVKIITLEAREMQSTLLLILGGLGLIHKTKSTLLLLGTVLAFFCFGLIYQVDDIDSMLIPLTTMLCLGLALSLHRLAAWLTGQLKLASYQPWLAFGLALGLGSYALQAIPLTAQAVDLSQDTVGQEMVTALRILAEDGHPLSVLAEGNTPLAIVQYARARYHLTGLEPVSATEWRTLYTTQDALGEPEDGPNRARIEAQLDGTLRQRWAGGRRIFYSSEVTDLAMLPLLEDGLAQGRYLQAHTSFPDLKQLLSGDMLPRLHKNPEHPLGMDMGQSLTLLGYDQRWVRRRAGIYLRLGLYWQIQTPLTQAYQVSLYAGGTLAEVLGPVSYTGFLLGSYPAAALPPDQTLYDVYELRLNQAPPAGFTPADLHLRLEALSADVPEIVEVVLPITPFPEKGPPSR